MLVSILLENICYKCEQLVKNRMFNFIQPFEVCSKYTTDIKS